MEKNSLLLQDFSKSKEEAGREAGGRREVPEAGEEGPQRRSAGPAEGGEVVPVPGPGASCPGRSRRPAAPSPRSRPGSRTRWRWRGAPPRSGRRRRPRRRTAGGRREAGGMVESETRGVRGGALVVRAGGRAPRSGAPSGEAEEDGGAEAALPADGCRGRRVGGGAAAGQVREAMVARWKVADRQPQVAVP